MGTQQYKNGLIGIPHEGLGNKVLYYGLLCMRPALGGEVRPAPSSMGDRSTTVVVFKHAEAVCRKRHAEEVLENGEF